MYKLHVFTSSPRENGDFPKGKKTNLQLQNKSAIADVLAKQKCNHTSMVQRSLKFDIFGTLTKTVHISVWPTPIWTRPATFERATRDLSNAAGLVQIGVDHAEIWSVFAGVPKIRICTCKRKIVPVNGKTYM